MGRHFLQLRDQGCQGAWEIFFRARELRQLAERPRSDGDAKVSVAVWSTREHDTLTGEWRESIALAGCTQKDVPGGYHCGRRAFSGKTFGVFQRGAGGISRQWWE